MDRWWPTSKMTAVFVAGALCTWGVFALGTFYGLRLEPAVVSLNQTWITFVVGYAVTEHREVP